MLACFLCVMITAVAQVKVELIEGIDNPTLKMKLERQTAGLLNAVQSAADRNGDINFSGLDLADNVAQSISATWNIIKFRPEDKSYVETVMTKLNGKGQVYAYQIRNIGVIPAHGAATDAPWDRQELCIDFSKTGRITNINFTNNNVVYANALIEADRLSDGHRRMQIVDWCERFAQYYMDKDTTHLRLIFAPDALIISGKVIVGKEKSTVRYTSQNVEQYLRNLKRIFARNRYIQVDFDQYEIMKHPTKENIYLVSVRQRWTNRQTKDTQSYTDLGTLTLVWDFRDEDFPRIQVRAWQALGMKPFNINTIPFNDKD